MEQKVIFNDKEFQRFVDWHTSNIVEPDNPVVDRYSDAICEIAEFLGSDADVLQSLVRISDENSNFWATMGYEYARKVVFEEILDALFKLKDSNGV